MKRVVWGSVALVAVAIFVALVAGDKRSDVDGDGQRAASKSSPAEGSTNDDPHRAARPASDDFAVAVAAVDGEDEISRRWDELQPSARVAELRAQFETAKIMLRRGEDLLAQRARADAALSALRAELYATPHGRREHQRLEAELDALLRRERVASGGEP